MMIVRLVDNEGKHRIIDAAYIEVEGVEYVEVHNKKWAFTISQEGE